MPITINGENGIVYDNLNNDIKNLLMPKNWIINGMFDVWQRGTSQTSSDYGSDDRWQNAHQVSTKTHSRQAFSIGQTEVPNNPKYFSRTVVTSGNSASSYVMKIQKVEDVTKISGKTMSYSFWAKADANKSMSVQVQQHFGTGGSLVVNSNIQKFNLTSAWQRFTMIMNFPSVVGKTIGDGNHTSIRFWFDGGSDFNALTNSLGNQSGTFDIANVSLVEGSVAVECQNQPYADVLEQCRDYYRRYGAKGGGTTSIYKVYGSGFILTATTHAFIHLDLGKPMRATPTIVSGGHLAINTMANAIVAVSAVEFDTATTNEECVVIKCTATGLPLNSPCRLIGNGNASNYLELSAEL